MAFVFTKKYVIGLSIAAGFLVTGAGTYFAVLPTVDTITSTQADIASAEADVQDMQSRLNGLKVSQGQYDNIKALDVQLEEQFPSTLEASLLQEINSAASQSSTDLSNVEFTPPAVVLTEAAADPNAAAPADPNAATDPNAAAGATGAATDPNAAAGAAPTTGFGDGFAKSTFTLSISGTEDNVKKFLEILNENGRAIIVNQASFTNESGDVTLSLTGQAYLTQPVKSPEELIAEQSQPQPTDGATDGGEVVVEDGSTTN